MTTTTQVEVAECLYCDRTCPRCRYDITGGWEHVEQVQPEGSNVAVCDLVRVKRPLAEVLDLYLTHSFLHHQGIQARAGHALSIVLPIMRLWGWPTR